MRDVLLIALCLVLGVAIGRWWPVVEPIQPSIHTVTDPAGMHPGKPGPSAATGMPDAVGITEPKPMPVRPLPAPSPPIPPTGTPLAESLPALKARAEAGDVEAATRWYREINLCRTLGPAPLRQPARPPVDLRSAASQCLRRHHCAGLPTELHPLAALRLAARNGNDDAAVAYASMPLLTWLHDPALQGTAPGWSGEATAWLARARERGHAWAWLVTAEALTGDRGSPDLRGALPADPHSGLAMLWALERVPYAAEVLQPLYAGADWVGLALRLDIAEPEQAALRAEGERLHRRYLSSRQHLAAEIAASYRLIALYAGGIRAGVAEVSPYCHRELSTDPALRDLPEPNPPRS